jgi:oligosaccharide repeat unit polymerase
MKLLLLIGGGVVGVLVGRKLFQRWFNHLSIYSTIWTVSLGLYELKLIQYNSIIPEAWFFILLAWFVFYLGSIMVLRAGIATRHASNYATVFKEVIDNSQRFFFINSKILKRSIIVLSVLAALSIGYHLFVVIHFFGGVKATILNANLLYVLRLRGEIQEEIPYLSSFALGACSLAGIYTAVRGKLTFVGVLPLVLIGLGGAASMGRASIFIAGVLFLTAFLYAPRQKLQKLSILTGLILAIALVIGVLTFISSTRGLIISFKYENPSMEILRRTHIAFVPSIYFYFSGPPVVFSEYLKAGGEKFYPGTYTLRPILNVLSKIGLFEPLPRYQDFYFTPEPMNTGTYLRELYPDFGPIGMTLFPYILGILLTILHLRIKKRPTLMHIVLQSHLYVIVFLSWLCNALFLGYYWISFIVSLFVSLKCSPKSIRGNKVQNGLP